MSLRRALCGVKSEVLPAARGGQGAAVGAGGGGGALPQLTLLALEAPRLPADVGHRLGQLTHLQSLSLKSSQMPGSLADDVAILMALTALELGCAESPLPPLVALAALPRLRRLWLADRGGCNFGAVLSPPPPADFPAGLEWYRFERSCGWLQVAGAQLRSCSWGPAGEHGAGANMLRLSGLRPASGMRLATLLHALTPAERPLRRLALEGGSTLEAESLLLAGGGGCSGRAGVATTGRLPPDISFLTAGWEASWNVYGMCMPAKDALSHLTLGLELDRRYYPLPQYLPARKDAARLLAKVTELFGARPYISCSPDRRPASISICFDPASAALRDCPWPLPAGRCGALLSMPHTGRGVGARCADYYSSMASPQQADGATAGGGGGGGSTGSIVAALVGGIAGGIAVGSAVAVAGWWLYHRGVRDGNASAAALLDESGSVGRSVGSSVGNGPGSTSGDSADGSAWASAEAGAAKPGRKEATKAHRQPLPPLVAVHMSLPPCQTEPLHDVSIRGRQRK
ncbi:hypothetical protein C2E20_3223 [Micractinium conductrix]|uniref:Uncharacterized protein n=1 Tax=Micractinium conductrix TaxID=554055 RepID=A0A2P6VHK9_9CHLO|nr:hypothetical protein C2E20_3223 [Micractinium conductrix]|eukprot:PSC73581.1 hypothetical protein C2E20_3223 [Micractinium conductrix]